MFIGFDRSRTKREQVLPSNKTIRRNCHIRKMLHDIIVVAEHQEKAVCGLGCKLTLKGNIDAIVKNEAAEHDVSDAKIVVSDSDWYYIPNVAQQLILSEQFQSKTSTELS